MKKIIALICFLMTIFGCVPANENVEMYRQQLSVAADLVFTISDKNLSTSGWGHNGTVYCDAQNRCISDNYDINGAATGIIKFTMPSCNSLITATLNFATTEWDSVLPKAEFHKLLKPITLPTCPIGTTVQDNVVGWRYAGSNSPWDILGAKGIGTDVSTEQVSISVGSGANVSHSIDVTSLVSMCVGNNECYLTVFSTLDIGQSGPSHHFWLLTGTPALVLSCEGSGQSDGGTTTSTTTSNCP